MMLSHLLPKVADRLATLSDTPTLDAQVLLAHVLGKHRTWLMAHPETVMTPNQSQILEADLERLEQGVPLPYILGHWEFYGLDIKVTPDVLIPRPETEILVEQALQWLSKEPDRRKALDIGCGSGCITVSLSTHTPDLDVIACDISFPALQVTKANAQLHNIDDQTTCVQCDLFPPVKSRFDLICSNLPYIPSEKLASLRVSENEPLLALDGGVEGLALIRRFLYAAPEKLTPGGLLLAEIEENQGRSVCALAKDAFPNADISILPDMAGRDRLLRVECERARRVSK